MTTLATKILLALVSAAAIISSSSHIGQVKCSSYLDDYFLPTAKLLTKLQQSLSPGGNNQPAPLPNVSLESNASPPTRSQIDYINQQAAIKANSGSPPPPPAPSSVANYSSSTEATSVTASKGEFLASSNGELSKFDAEEAKVGAGEFVKLEDKLAASSASASADSPPSAVQQLAPQINGLPSSSEEVRVDSSGASQLLGEAKESASKQPDSSSWKPSETITTTISTDSATDSDPATTSSAHDAAAAAAATLDSQDQMVDTNSGEPRLSVDTLDESTSSKTKSSTLVAPATTTTSTTTIQPETPTENPENNRQHKQAVEQQTQTVPPVIVIESKSADEAAIKETELEAVAAVEASIGFGDLFSSMSDSCYDEYANARFCEPEFENVAFERQVEVSSECGNPPSRFCTVYLNERHEQIRNCHICDAQHPKKRHPAAYLTDMSNSNSPTCWVSAPINAMATPSSLASSINNNNANYYYNSSAASSTGPMSNTIQASSSIISSESALPAAALQNTNANRPDNVTLILNLDKKYEIVYISMQFCSMKPDSLAIYKSMDYGRSWIPYQFYSSQCRRMYGRQPMGRVGSGPVAGAAAGRHQATELEASCTNSSSSQQSSSSASSGRIAFSTLDGRAGAGGFSSSSSSGTSSSGHNLDSRAQQLQDWITATNIKIVLDRHQASWIHSNLIHPHAHNHHNHHQSSSSASASASSSAASEAAGTGSGSSPPKAGGQQLPVAGTAAAAAAAVAATVESIQTEPAESSLTSPSDTFNYAMSDLTVGGRCKCNGHASRCIHSKEGRLQCDCRHNTAGRDCEKCAPFHFDRPWARATQLDANPCQPCNCNGHSRKCRFDVELYRMSGKRSGGVCIGCRDNTAGRFCNYCKEDYTRDHSKPMSDKEACKYCDCHPIGSLGRACNQTTGQCPCKEGVSGLQCNRCAPGYQQSSSLTDPCIKLPENENDINYYPPLTVDGDDRSVATSEQQNPPQEANVGTAATADPLDEAVPPVVGSPRPNGSGRLNSQAVDQDLTMGVDSMSTGGNSQFSPDPVHPQDKDNEASEASEAEPPASGGGGAMHKHHRVAQLAPVDHWQLQQQHQVSRKANAYYGYHPASQRQAQRPNGGQQQFEPTLTGGSLEDDYDHDQDQDEDEPSTRRTSRPMPADDEYPMHPAAAAAAGRPNYYTDAFSKPQRYMNDYRHRRLHAHNGPAQRHRSETDLMMQPVASVEHGPDELNSLDAATNFRIGPPNTMYANTEDNFNQIQTPNFRRIATTGSRGRQAPGKHRSNGGGGSGGQFVSEAQPMLGWAGSNEVVCGDCQSGTRRLAWRQFCHLHFAIRATILNKYMADDWTKFEVEIQDIFRSQGSTNQSPEQITSGRGTNGGGAFNGMMPMSNMLQGDEPSLARGGNGSTVLLDGSTIEQNVATTHRIKVGTIQSIWVPTEDLNCRCPRLRLRATYLLMGSIDAKENSANVLQLDRHGIALEWRSSLQEKLMRYQRRLSRGGC